MDCDTFIMIWLANEVTSILKMYSHINLIFKKYNNNIFQRVCIKYVLFIFIQLSILIIMYDRVASISLYIGNELKGRECFALYNDKNNIIIKSSQRLVLNLSV